MRARARGWQAMIYRVIDVRGCIASDVTYAVAYFVAHDAAVVPTEDAALLLFGLGNPGESSWRIHPPPPRERESEQFYHILFATTTVRKIL